MEGKFLCLLEEDYLLYALSHITAPRLYIHITSRLYIHGTGMRRGDKRKPKPQELKFQRLANNNQNVQNGREACEGNDIKPEK